MLSRQDGTASGQPQGVMARYYGMLTGAYCAFRWYCSTDMPMQAARGLLQIPEQALPMFASLVLAEQLQRKTLYGVL